jgi:hypothetical protein
MELNRCDERRTGRRRAMEHRSSYRTTLGLDTTLEDSFVLVLVIVIGVRTRASIEATTPSIEYEQTRVRVRVPLR